MLYLSTKSLLYLEFLRLGSLHLNTFILSVQFFRDRPCNRTPAGYILYDNHTKNFISRQLVYIAKLYSYIIIYHPISGWNIPYAFTACRKQKFYFQDLSPAWRPSAIGSDLPIAKNEIKK